MIQSRCNSEQKPREEFTNDRSDSHHTGGNARKSRGVSGGENFLNVVQSMSNLIGTLREEWEGQASEKFAEQFEALRPSFNEMGELIESIAKQCDGVADATQALDEEMAAKFIS